MKTVVTFLVTRNPEAALAFYRDTLGFHFLRDDGFALVFLMQEIMLRISRMEQFTPAQYTVLGWESEDILADVEALKAKGVVFQHYPYMNPDEHGIVCFPNGDRVAWFTDPDGNVLSLSQHAAR